MEENQIIELVEEKTEQKNKSVVDTLQQIFGSGKEKAGMSDTDIKDIENIKLIISAILNDDLVESLTNLDPDELDDINDALYLNEFADNPRLYIYIAHRLKLSRSKVTHKNGASNLLEIFSDISGKGMSKLSNMENNSVLGKRFG
jgi:hypothetical protein